ncbi:MAG: tetratricopeptide repeat protein [Myxococcota bacterium]
MGVRLGTLSVWVGLAACAHVSTSPPPAPNPEASDVGSARSELCAEGWVAAAEQLEETDVGLARQRLERCLREATGPPSAYRLLATLQSDAGDAELALRTLLKAVARHPGDPFAWAGLARLQAELGRGPASLGSLERAHRLRPEDDLLKDELALARRRFGSPRDRLFALLSSHLGEADGRLDLGDLEGVESVLNRAEVVAGEDVELLAHVRLRWAWLALAREEPDRASAAVEAALDGLAETGADGLRADLLVIRSELELRSGDCDVASRLALEALRRRARHPLAATNLGVASACRGDLASAERHYRSAVAWGLGARLDRASFVALDGVEELMARQDDFAALVDAVWPP